MGAMGMRVTLGLAGLAVVLLTGCSTSEEPAASPSESMSVSPSASATATAPSFDRRDATMSDAEALDRIEHPQTGETWFTTPVAIAAPPWAVGDDYLDQGGWTQWFELGTRADRTIVGFQSVTVANFFERDATGGYEWIAFPSAKDDPATTILWDDFIDVPKNTTVYYDSLALPSQIVLPSGEPLIVPQYDHGSFEAPGMGATELPSGTVVETVGEYQITRIVVPTDWIWSGPYSVTAPAGLSYSDLYYVLTTPYGMYIPVMYNPIGSLEDITWHVPNTVAEDGETARLVDLMDVGCGEHDSDHNTIVVGTAPSDWVVAGTSARGETLYVPTVDNPLVEPMYEAYVQAQEMFDVTPVSETAFLGAPALIAYQTPVSGELVVYLNGAYSGRAWC